jgi:RNA polymerase sigma factor (sigma-70 family)
LIAASRAEPEQFAAIFERHFDAIYRYLAFRLGPTIADDVAGETFALAFDKRASYRLGYDDARPWLFGIATNLVHRRRRAERRQLQAYPRSIQPDQDFDEAAIIKRVDADASKARIAGALAALEQRDRDVLLLFAVADQSYEAIADTLGIPLGTVRSRLNRARRLVRRNLGLPIESGVDQVAQTFSLEDAVDG